jgi:dTDP-4-dehydrorhamnose 3,5-epimerase
MKIIERFDKKIAGQCPILLQPNVFVDDRGCFFEAWSEQSYQGLLLPPERFVQDNVSESKRGTVRGLHFQVPPFAQGKLVSVHKGRVFDVAVDIRTGSSTFGRYVAVELSGEDHRQFWIPAGFAHGFMALEEGTIFSYKVTNPYHKASERAIRWDDSTIGIVWPEGIPPIVSPKDAAAPLMAEIDQTFKFGDY